MLEWVNSSFKNNYKIKSTKLWLDKIISNNININDIEINTPMLAGIVRSDSSYQHIIIILKDLHNISFYNINKDYTVNTTSYYKSTKFSFCLTEQEREFYIINYPNFINNLRSLII